MSPKRMLVLASTLISCLLLLTIFLILYPRQQIVLNPDPAFAETIAPADLEQTRQVIDRRLSLHNLPGWSRASINGDKIVVTLPRAAPSAAIIRDLTEPGYIALIETGVEFLAVDAAYRVRTSYLANPDETVYQVLLDSADFVAAQNLASPSRDIGFRITLTPQGAARLATFLAQQHGIYLCLTQDNVVIGCPIVQFITETEIEIRQGATDFLIDDKTLVERINAGALPVPLVAAHLPNK